MISFSRGLRDGASASDFFFWTAGDPVSEPARVWMVEGGEVKPCWLFLNEHEQVYVDERGQWRSRGLFLNDGALLPGYFVHRDQAVRSAVEWLEKEVSPEGLKRDEKWWREEQHRRAQRLEQNRQRLAAYRAELSPPRRAKGGPDPIWLGDHS